MSYDAYCVVHPEGEGEREASVFTLRSNAIMEWCGKIPVSALFVLSKADILLSADLIITNHLGLCVGFGNDGQLHIENHLLEQDYADDDEIVKVAGEAGAEYYSYAYPVIANPDGTPRLIGTEERICVGSLENNDTFVPVATFLY